MKLPARQISRLCQYMLLTLVLMLGGTGQPLVHAQEKVIVEWHPTSLFPDELDSAIAMVDAFNASQDEIELLLIDLNSLTTQEYLDTAVARKANVIVTRLELRAASRWSWLDLDSLIEASNYDLSRYDSRVLDLYRRDGHLNALPIMISPQVIFYNRDLFDAAGVAYPPHHLGEAYADGDAWDMAKLKEVALQLTLDKQGRNALDVNFDSDDIAEYGYIHQWFDGVPVLMAPFGVGSLLSDEKHLAMPDSWRAGLAWYYDGWQTSHFIPTSAALQAKEMLSNPFGSGHVAMALGGLWLVCCTMSDSTPLNWDMAMLPSYNGQVTGYMYEGALRILKDSSDPDAAFKAAAYLADRLAETPWAFSGGLPAQKAFNKHYSDTLSTKYTQGVDWQVGVDSLEHAVFSYDTRRGDEYQLGAREATFLDRLQNTPNLDLDKEIDAFLEELQTLFDELFSTNG